MKNNDWALWQGYIMVDINTTAIKWTDNFTNQANLMLVTDVGLLSTDFSPTWLMWFLQTQAVGMRLVVRLQQHHLPGWSSRCICLLSGSGSVFTMGCQQGPLGWAWQLWLWLWLWWGYCGMGSIGLGDLTSAQLDGAVTAKTLTSVNDTSNSIAHWSSTTLSARQWGWPGIGSWAFSPQYWNDLM